MKQNLVRCQEILDDWNAEPLLMRHSKPVSVAEALDVFKSHLQSRYSVITTGGKEIHVLLKKTNKALKVSKGAVDWKAYVDFINNIAVEGICDVVNISLKSLHAEIDKEIVEKEDKSVLSLARVETFERNSLTRTSTLTPHSQAPVFGNRPSSVRQGRRLCAGDQR